MEQKDFMVAELNANEWRFINYMENLKLKKNCNVIPQIREEICQKMLELIPCLVLNRYDQQVNLNMNNNKDSRYKLLNIGILKKDLDPLLVEVPRETICPKWHINNLQMFRLWHTSTLNHEYCIN